MLRQNGYLRNYKLTTAGAGRDELKDEEIVTPLVDITMLKFYTISSCITNQPTANSDVFGFQTRTALKRPTFLKL